MSRSYKKTPVSKDWVRTSKRRKTFANRKFRRTQHKDVGVCKSQRYKRYSESWDIHDYVFRWTREDAINSWFKEEAICAIHGYDLSTYGWHRDYASLEEFLNKCWRKCVHSK